MRHSTLACFTALGLMFAPLSPADEAGSNQQPLSFGDVKTIVDVDKIVWGPLETAAGSFGKSGGGNVGTYSSSTGSPDSAGSVM